MPSVDLQGTKIVSRTQQGQTCSATHKKPQGVPHGNTRIFEKYRRRVVRLFDSGKYEHFTEIAAAMNAGKDPIRISRVTVSKIIAEEMAKRGSAQ